LRRNHVQPSRKNSLTTLHNSTAGSEQGIAAARSLGDLSHNVYAPSLRSERAGAKEGELLFIDWWDSPKGIMDFFSNPQVQQQGGKLFSERDATLWMPASGSSSYHLYAPKSKPERYVGIVRGMVKSPEHVALCTASAPVLRCSAWSMVSSSHPIPTPSPMRYGLRQSSEPTIR